MSNTTIKLDKEYFTEEITKKFLIDLEIACGTMETDLFAKLFLKYDLSFIEDYKEVLDTIIAITTAWYDPEKETVILNMDKYDSKCIFCKIGKTVTVYKWTYKSTKGFCAPNIIYSQSIAFYFDFQNNRLIEFGLCNGHLDKEEVINLNN